LAPQRDVACHFADVETGRLADALDGFGNLAAVGRGICLFFLDVQVLCVFTDDDEVDGPCGAADALYRSDIGVELQAFAERDDGRGVTLCGDGGRGYGAEERAVARGFEGFDGFFG
jgi:hypothetical protein